METQIDGGTALSVDAQVYSMIDTAEIGTQTITSRTCVGVQTTATPCALTRDHIAMCGLCQADIHGDYGEIESAVSETMPSKIRRTLSG